MSRPTGFSWRSTKDARVLIDCGGRTAKTLAGARASRFHHDVGRAGGEEAQLLLARATGHSKRGNER